MIMFYTLRFCFGMMVVSVWVELERDEDRIVLNVMKMTLNRHFGLNAMRGDCSD